ncbi:MAG: hypothetical protein MJE66_02640 [Proteobacteria bacterium]|nr:hypothetical protein [Pseudomonadota bacterium]
MPAKYLIDRRLGTVFSAVYGFVTDEDLLGHQQRLAADRRFSSGFNQLFWVRDVIETTVTGDCVREAARATLFGPPSKRVFVVARTTAFGFARMFQALRAGKDERIHVCRTMDEALAWLPLAPSDLPLAWARRLPPRASPSPGP